jgi:hypothetical protein
MFEFLSACSFTLLFPFFVKLSTVIDSLLAIDLASVVSPDNDLSCHDRLRGPDEEVDRNWSD